MDIVLVYNERTGGESCRIYTQIPFETVNRQRVERQFGAPQIVTQKVKANCACVTPEGTFALELTPMNAVWVKAMQSAGMFDLQNPDEQVFVDQMAAGASTVPGAVDVVPEKVARKPRARKAAEAAAEPVEAAAPVIEV